MDLLLLVQQAPAGRVEVGVEVPALSLPAPHHAEDLPEGAEELHGVGEEDGGVTDPGPGGDQQQGLVLRHHLYL